MFVGAPPHKQQHQHILESPRTFFLILGQFLRSRIGGSKTVISDRRPNRAFLRSRKSAFSIPILWIKQYDPHIPSRKSSFSTGCADRIARSKKKMKPNASLTTPQNTGSHPTTGPMVASLVLYCCCCCCCCCCLQGLGVAHPVLRPPAARTVIRSQQCVLSMTCLQHCCGSSCCCTLLGDSRSPTPQPRR